MKRVEVKNQVRLSLAKCFELVLSGIRYRLFRAAITVVIIALAVTFLKTMLSESLITRRIAGAVEAKALPRETLRFWVARMTTGLRHVNLTRQLDALWEERQVHGNEAWAETPRAREFLAWGGLTEEQLKELTDLAHEERRYLRYFQSVDEGERSQMVGRARGWEIFAALQDPNRLQTLKDRQPSMSRKLTDIEELESFLNRWSQAMNLREKIVVGHAEAIAATAEEFRRQDAREVLAAADSETQKRLARHGFVLSEAEMQLVREEAQYSLDRDRITSMLDVKNGFIRSRLANRIGQKPMDTTAAMLLAEVSSSSGAEWLLEVIREENENTRRRNADPKRQGDPEPLIPEIGLDRQRIMEVGKRSMDQQHLREVEALLLAEAGGHADRADEEKELGMFGFTSRTLSLIVVSFLVCTVGIVNAMLMSVTERFREIATMKCLGATDQFIMINFIMESCMQGVAGSVIGAVLGFLLGLLRSVVMYGGLAVQNLPISEMFAAAGIAMVVGVVLSALAAVYPAWVAARLAPMEAMRIE